METDRPVEGEDPRFIAWAKQRMKEMNEEAEEVTKALGLPPEAKFTVLQALYGGRRSTRLAKHGTTGEQPGATPPADQPKP